MRCPSIVYFIGEHETEGPVKIGLAKKGQRTLREAATMRLICLQVGNPRPLLVLAVMMGSWLDERELHGRFADFRLVSEWFRRTPELQALIDEVCASEPVEEPSGIRLPRRAEKHRVAA